MKQPHKKNWITPTICIVTVGIAVAGIAWLATNQPPEQVADTEHEEVAVPQQPTSLSVDAALHDFGTVPMSGGTVTHDYVVTNTSGAAVTLSSLYTSCMCTEATLMMSEGGSEPQTRGPFGMPGHGGSAGSFEETLEPGATAKVVSVFDPNAHGPAGVGPIDRFVTLETSDGPLQMRFTGNVTP